MRLVQSLVLLLAVVAGAGCQGGPPGYGIISGKVSAPDGQPIASAILDFRRADGLQQTGEGRATLEDGTFDFELEATTYHLTVRAEGYAVYQDDVQVSIDQRLKLRIVLHSD